MALLIGVPAGSDFTEPLALMSECHRRVERFLGVLVRAADELSGKPLNPEEREAIATSLRYFRDAAPKHTQDEETSVFPRLRALGEPAREAFETMDRLEGDHAVADSAHAEVQRLGWQWVEQGELASEEAEQLRRLLTGLRQIYERHIQVEDEVLFPLAERLLPAAAQTEIGKEMAARRGVRFASSLGDTPPR
ncbi:hemerythrin domain-containing protein [Candidatus Poribacteria bacterium]|nr:hemerythrin domain-containing protein [Candidatus Poribacteria bacterium]